MSPVPPTAVIASLAVAGGSRAVPVGTGSRGLVPRDV